MIPLAPFAASLIVLAAELPGRGEGLIACAERPATRDYWSWREIDGRKCWFIGHRTMPKSQLFWRTNDGHGDNLARRVPVRSDDMRPDPIEDVSSPPLGAFERAWRDLQIDLVSPALLDPRRLKDIP